MPPIITVAGHQIDIRTGTLHVGRGVIGELPRSRIVDLISGGEPRFGSHSFPAPCRDDMDEPLTCENSLVRYGCIQYHHLLNLLEADRQMVDGVPAQGGQRDRVAIDPQTPSSSFVDTLGGGCSAPVLTIDGESGPGIYQ